MRVALIGSTIVALALGGACGLAAAASDPATTALNSLLAPEPGNKACYVRNYDAAHLRAHPHQRITAMKFLLGVDAYDPKPAGATKPEDLFYYTFAMSVARRGDKRLLRAFGDCRGSDRISCVVDCDGGGVTLDTMPPAGSLIVRLNDNGIRMFHDCDQEDGVLVKPAADDKVFRLDKVASDACRTLESEEK